MTEEQRERKREQQRQRDARRYAGRTPEQRERVRARQRHWKAGLTPEQKVQKRERHREWKREYAARHAADPEFLERQREYAREASRRSREKNPLACALHYARYRAKKKGIEFSITLADINQPVFCPVLGVRLDYSAGTKGHPQPNSPSLDRIDSRLGYVKGNVLVISQRANTLKGDGTADELRAVADYAEFFLR